MSRAALALTLEVVFFAMAFGWRSWVQWRRTGSTGFVRPRRDASRAELAGSVGFVTALLLLAVGPLADLLGLFRWAWLDNVPAAFVGVILATGGIVLTLIAQLSMGDSWRIGVEPSARTELVTAGLFAHVRNPIFTAMILATFGIALLVPNVLTAAAVVVLVAALQVQVRLVEEPYLDTVHGAAYDHYQSRSGRFLPQLGSPAAHP